MRSYQRWTYRRRSTARTTARTPSTMSCTATPTSRSWAARATLRHSSTCARRRRVTRRRRRPPRSWPFSVIRGVGADLDRQRVAPHAGLEPLVPRLGLRRDSRAGRLRHHRFWRRRASPDTVTAVYPYAGQSGVPTSFNGRSRVRRRRHPRRVAERLPGAPLSAGRHGSESSNHGDGTTAPISHTWIDHQPDEWSRPIHSLSDKPLMANTTYHVAIAAMRGTTPLTFDWKFTTGAR